MQVAVHWTMYVTNKDYLYLIFNICTKTEIPIILRPKDKL